MFVHIDLTPRVSSASGLTCILRSMDFNIFCRYRFLWTNAVYDVLVGDDDSGPPDREMIGILSAEPARFAPSLDAPLFFSASNEIPQAQLDRFKATFSLYSLQGRISKGHKPLRATPQRNQTQEVQKLDALRERFQG